MFYDLNVPWSEDDHNVSRTLAFLHEIGYNVVALNHTITGALPKDLKCPIPDPLPLKDIPPKLSVLRRVTLVLTESHQNARLAALAREYDILALRPIDERTLQLACSSLECDIISLDLSQRLPYHFKFKMLNEAIHSGKRLELNYSQGLLGDAQARRALISNATQLIRATRGGRKLIICSETKAGAIGCRGPWDAINLAAVWGLGQERGHEAISKEARSVVVSAKLKRTGYRGAIDVVYGGEKPATQEKSEGEEGKAKQKQQQKQQQGQKRKADAVSGSPNGSGEGEQPMSKRQAKKLAHQARLKAAEEASGNGSLTMSKADEVGS